MELLTEIRPSAMVRFNNLRSDGHCGFELYVPTLLPGAVLPRGLVSPIGEAHFYTDAYNCGGSLLVQCGAER